MGGSGNILTLRNQSGTNGRRTLYSIISSDSANGAGSPKRVYSWYAKNNNLPGFYKFVLGFYK